MILAGKDKGKTGEVSDVIRSKNHFYVKGMNTVSIYLTFLLKIQDIMPTLIG